MRPSVRALCLLVLLGVVLLAASAGAGSSAAEGSAASFVPFVAGGSRPAGARARQVAGERLQEFYVHIHNRDHLRAQRPNFHQFVFVPDFDHLNRRPSTARLLPAFQLALKSS